MKTIKSLLLLLILSSSLGFAQEPQEDIIVVAEHEQETECTYKDNDIFTDDFSDIDMDRTSNYQEPTRLQTWATAVGITLLIKYFEMREAVSDWSDSASQWWRNLLVFCHIASDEKNQTSDKDNEQQV